MSDFIEYLFPYDNTSMETQKIERLPLCVMETGRSIPNKRNISRGDGSLPLAYETTFSIFRDESCDLSPRNRSYDALPPGDFHDLLPHLR